MEISVHEWKSEQVIEWLRGIECISNLYIKAFANNHIDGRTLLDLRNSELHELGITSVGHQEIILEAVSHLREFHYNLDKTNLQYMSMQVGSLSTSLYKLLERDPIIQSINTQILNEVTRVVSKIKTLISWLDLNPFQGHTQYSEIRVNMLKLGLELATISQRDRFAQDPIKQIKSLAKRLSQLTDYIIQDITDPMLLQPAYLDLATAKKRESGFGFYVQPSYQFIHRVTDIKYNSPAHTSGKIEEGDEIVQINYQTVVGWQYKNVLKQLNESPTDVVLTLKKRPKHTKIYGQLGLIKLPSKKRSLPYRFDNIPSPRFELFNAPDLLIPLAKIEQKGVVSDVEDSSGNESDATAEVKADKETRLYMPKPRAALQRRRHTICGDDLTNFQNIGNLVSWHNRKIDVDNLDSPSLRDKSVSFGFGLELTQRPTTCLGISDSLPKSRLKTSLPSMTGHIAEAIKECEEKPDILSSGVSKVVRFDSNRSLEYNNDSKYVCNVEDTIIESHMPIPYADEVETNEVRQQTPPVPAPRKSLENRGTEDFVETVNTVVVNREIVKRGRLDKSHSTPTYTDESDVPPAIEPRQHVIKIPPVPPRKTAVVIPPITIESNDENKSKVANVIDLKGTKTLESNLQVPSHLGRTPPSTNSLTKRKISPPTIEKPFKPPPAESGDTLTELVTPVKVKTLTNRKKNSLMAKRRKVDFKSLGLGTSTTIQGHLYRRAKDKTDVAYWAKFYFILIETALYGFKTKDSPRADCVIFLSGFAVSLAKEVHSKQYAFKVYHPKKTFYLAAETKEALAQWMEYIKQAAMKGETNLECEPRELYSETECSDDDLEFPLTKQICTPSPLKPSEKIPLSEQTPPASKPHYHLNFGSLKKFARGSNASPNNVTADNSSPSDHKFFGFFSTSKSAEKKSADIVPTSQFKTYKKVKENGGLQLGATSMINSTVSDMYLQNGADSSIISGFTLAQKKAEDTTSLTPIIHRNDIFEEESFEEKTDKSFKLNKRSLNYLHASNPNLLDYNYHSTGDFPMSSSSNHSTWDHHQGSGMTLLDLMKQQLDEEKKDMYNRRVEQGVEKASEGTLQKKKEKPAIPPKPADPHIEKIQKRSLPVTPDYAQSFKPDDKELRFTRTKEGQKLRDFGYEFISGDDSATVNPVVVDGSKMWPSKRSDKVVPASGSLKKRSGFNWMIGSEKDDSSSVGNSGSFRKSKNKIENIKIEKSLKGSSSFVVQPNPQQLLSSKVLRKNSAPNSGTSSVIPYFSKLAFSSSSCKEKKLLGSPKLHRAIFGSKTPSSPSTSSNVDNEIFTSITFPPKLSRHSESSSRRVGLDSPEPSHISPFPVCNYPDLQQSLPPVFKPEIYSYKNTKND